MAVTMFSVLMVGTSAHLRGGLVVWRRATTSVEALQRRRVVLERLTQDLANAVVVDSRPDSTPPRILASDTMQFYTVRQDRSHARGGAGGLPGRARVWFVTYTLEQTSEGHTLLRSAQTIREAKAGRSAQPGRLLLNVERLTIRYGSLSIEGKPGIVWRETWDDPDQLPKLVEVTVDVHGTSSPLPRQIRQVVVIPSGILKPVEEQS